MINKFFLKNKTLKAVITAAMLSVLISGCGNNTSNTITKEESNFFASDEESNEDSDENKDDSEDDEYEDYDESEIEFEDDSDEFVNDDTNTYSHTIMVYMVGSDLESQYGNATADLKEMIDAQPDTENNNIVVLTGGASKWQIPRIESDQSCLLELKDGDFHIKESYDSANMGDPNNLNAFITYCFDEYDTDKYSLILWNHGAGPVMGFGLDENYGDIMSLIEIKEALESSVGQSDKKLEFIGFDACLMSSLEIADTLAPFANYMIASQETEPGYGWNYEFLSKLSDPGMNGAGLSKEIIDSYMDYSNEIFEENPKYYSDITLSSMDLSKYDTVEKTLDSYFNEVGSTLNTESLPKIIRKRNKLRNFGSFSSNYNYSLVDARKLIETLANEDNKDTAKDVITALDDMIIYEQTNMENAHGISVCFPYQAEEEYQETSLKVNETITFAPKYAQFLDTVYALQNGDPITADWDVTTAETSVETVDVTEGNITSEGRDITLQLTPEQQKSFAGANFLILANAKKCGYAEETEENVDDLYFYVYCGKNVQMDENGKLHGLYDNNIIYLKDTSDEEYGELSNVPMIVADADITNSKEKRYTSIVLLQNTIDVENGEDLSDFKFESAELQIIRDAEHPNGYVRSAIPLVNDDEEIRTPSKQLLDLDDFTTMGVYSSYARYLTTDENGKTLPFFNWKESSTMMGFETDITNGIEFVSSPITNPENYACMFILYDAQGNTTASDLIPLK